MTGIFISYRRSGSKTTTYRLVDDLRRAYGPTQIFLDVESIEAGISFADAIKNSLHKSSIALIIIGPAWATITNDEGVPRIHDQSDWVRQEVRAALQSNARVIPVLVEGAEMPEAHQLPEDIRDLTQLQAFTLLPSQTYWAFDVNRLITQISAIDKSFKRQDIQNSSTSSGLHYSYKVISGFVLYGLIVLTGTLEGWMDSDELLGAIFIFLVAAGLFGFGLQDSRKNLVTGKKGAITGLVLCGISIIGYAFNYSAMLNQESDLMLKDQSGYSTPAPPAVDYQPANLPTQATHTNLTGRWSSPQGSLVIVKNGETVSFIEYNPLGVQVGEAEGVMSGNQFVFDYINHVMSFSANGIAAVTGQNLYLTLTEPNTGQQFNFVFYRQ